MKQAPHSRRNLIYIFNIQKTFMVLMTVIFASLTSNAIAQFSAGDKFLRGSFHVSISSTKSDNSAWSDSDTKTRQFSFHPAIGVFINDHWAVGGGLGYENTTQRSEYQTGFQKYKTNTFSFDLMARRYFEISDKFYFAVEGNPDFVRGTTVSSNNTGESKTNFYDIRIAVRPLLIFFPSRHWSIEGGFGDLHYWYSRNLSTDTTTSNFGLNYSSSLYFGFAYYFRKAE